MAYRATVSIVVSTARQVNWSTWTSDPLFRDTLSADKSGDRRYFDASLRSGFCREGGHVTDTETAPNYGNAALITIDTQVDTLDGQPLEIPGTTAAIANISELCRMFRRTGQPIVHVVRLYLADGGNAEPSRRDLVRGSTPILRPGTPGRLIAPGVLEAGCAALDDELLLEGRIQLLGKGEVAMYKPRWGAFFHTPLEAHLQALGVDTLIFSGCNFPNCPRASIYEASERDYRVVLANDAVSGLYERGAAELEGIGVHVLSTEELLSELQIAVKI
jgi:nicotinamidase-related amidase